VTPAAMRVERGTPQPVQAQVTPQAQVTQRTG
jgi:hypothetical protein